MDLFPFLHSDVKTLPFPVNGSKYRPEVLRIQAYGLILLVMIYAVVLCIILANTFTCVFYITTVFVNQKLLDSKGKPRELSLAFGVAYSVEIPVASERSS